MSLFRLPAARNPLPICLLVLSCALPSLSGCGSGEIENQNATVQTPAPQAAVENQPATPAEESMSSPSATTPPLTPETETPQPTPVAKKNLKEQIIGFWALTSVDGKRVPPQMADEPMEITAETISQMGPRPTKYLLDETTDPARLEIDGAEGEPMKLRALVKLEGDKLTLKAPDLRNAENLDAPFPESWDQPGTIAMVLERAKSPPRPLIEFGRDIQGIYVDGAAFRSDGKAVALCLSGDLLLWDLENQRKVTRIDTNIAGGIHNVDWSPDGKWISVAGDRASRDKRKGGIIYKADTMEPAIELDQSCAFMKFSPDGRFFAAGAFGVEPQLWSTSSGKMVFELNTGTKQSEHGAISHDSKWFASTSYRNKSIYLFETSSGKLVSEIPLPDGAQPRQLAFHPDGKHLLVAVEGETRGVMNFDLSMKQGSVIFDEEVADLAFSADGGVLAFLVGDYIEIRDPGTFEVLESYPNRMRYGQVALSRDGRYVLRSSLGMGDLFDRQAPEDHPTIQWPAPLTTQQQAEFEKAENFFGLYGLILNTQDRLANIDQDGKPILSWRARVAMVHEPQMGIDRQSAWDSPTNARPAAEAPYFFRLDDPEPGKTVIQMVSGPGAAWNGTNRLNPGQDPDTILLLETARESAVPWLAPQDFAYDPNDPWKGLPREGFYAEFTDGKLGFVRGDTPPEVLKAMFTIDGKEPVDRKKWVLSPTMRFAFGPDETNPLPPFAPK